MILVVAEVANGIPSRSTLELITCARNSGVEGPIAALVLGEAVDAVATELSGYVDQVLVGNRPELASPNPEIWAAAVAQIGAEGEARLILISGSRSGREYSPRVAVRLDAALLEDVISLRSEGVSLRAQHYTYLSRVTETVEAQGTAVATTKPGAFDPAQKLSGELGEQFDVDLDLPVSRFNVTRLETPKTSRVSLSEADVVVAGGRGVGSADNFARFVEGLADRVGAAVGATRAVVDAGWRPYAEQVGQTGKTVQPKVYIGLGISGAVQHLSGMNKSKLIVVVNKDAEAPIFSIADFGIVGEVAEIIPRVLERLGT